jgi:hypothetical protein
MADREREALCERITDYLASGGLYNPELANHAAVRDLLIGCRAALSAPQHSHEAPEVRLDGEELDELVGDRQLPPREHGHEPVVDGVG